MKGKFLLVRIWNLWTVLVLGISLIWAEANAQPGNSGQWRGFVQGTEVQMPTDAAPSPVVGPGQEVPLMYGPGGAEALLNAVRRAETSEGQQFLLDFMPQQNTIDAAPPIAPPLGANFTGPSWGGIWTPGDPVIAAGSTYVGVMINSQCDFYTKAGVWSGGSVLKVFFAPVYDTLNYRDPFDVKIIFDHHFNRWVMLALTYNAAASQGRYLLAVSQTINPLGLWWIWALNSTDPLEPAPAKWPDYPGLGFDADSGVYVTSNQYTFANAFTYAKIRALRKGALYAGAAIWWDYWGMLDADGVTLTFTIKPAHTFGNPGVEYLVNTKWNGGNVVNMWQLLPGWALPVNMGTVPIGGYWPPPTPMCSDSGLNLFDCRTQDAQYRDNHLYTSFHEEWDWGTGVRAVVRFLKIDIPTMVAAVDERYGHQNYHYFFPSIYSSALNNIVTIFNRCGSMEFISARYSARLLTQGDVASRASLYLKAGQAWYGDWVNPNRWGDYSGIAYDPFQWCTMWIYSMYATNAPQPANWSTWIGEVFTHPAADTLRNHFKTWRIVPQDTLLTVMVEDQFMQDDITLDRIEFFSNPARKDTFEIVDSLEHLTWYRAHGRDTLLEVEYSNQFGIDTVCIDSVKYLLLPTAKEDYLFPESLDHYKAYRIKDPLAFERTLELEDQFDVLYELPEFIDSLKAVYFLTPALKNMTPSMFDPITHYVAYEIFPQRFFPLSVTTFDQFGDHFLEVDTSKFLLVPTEKLRAEPPPTPDTLRNHFKTWRIVPQDTSLTVVVEDQFMQDDLALDRIEFLSNPARKDTFEIVDIYEHLTWYRAHGRDTLLEVEYENQFGSATVLIDSVKYLLLPTAKEDPALFPESLDHYKAYRIKDPLTFERTLELEDQFDLMYGEPEFIDSLKPVYFLTPALKEMPPPMFDSITHYVAYEIFPQRFFPLSVTTFDQFGEHALKVDTSKFLLVPTKKLRAEPPPTPNHYKTWRILPQTFDTTVFVQDQFMQDSLRLVGLEFLSNPVTKIVQNDTFNIIKPNDHLTWYRAFGRDTLIHVGWVNQFQTEPIPIPIDSVKYLLVPTEKQPHAPPQSLDHYKCYRIAMDMGWVDLYFTLQDQFDTIPEDIIAMSTPVYFCAPCQKSFEPTFDTTTHYVAYLISQDTSTQSRLTVDQFGSHLLQIQNSEILLVPSEKLSVTPPPECSDGLDNDGDGLIDFPADCGCSSAFDNSEAPNPTTKCSDGIDNDGDGLIDLADCGCTDVCDSTEAPNPARQCNDGIDNDGDGLIDLADCGCTDVCDSTEAPNPVTQCNDGIDNDGDGLIDLADCGCTDVCDSTEAPNPVTQCSDGIDNDGDGLIDFPADPGCRDVCDNDESRNHYKTWLIEPQPFLATVFVQDQFMSDSLILDTIEFFSNPTRKDSSEIADSLEHLTWYRAHGRDTLLQVVYRNQFGPDTVCIDSVKYLLLPTAKEVPEPFPEDLDHYKAYRIKNPVAFGRTLELEDQFDVIYDSVEVIDSLKPVYFLTPALKNMPPPMFDSITHYVAYEIFPKRFFPISVHTFDQFEEHTLRVDTSELLLVPTKKLISFIRGDVNGDGKITVSDVVYLINYLFKGGPPPLPVLMAGDVNCDGTVSVSDVVYLINYLFKGGAPPCCQ